MNVIATLTAQLVSTGWDFDAALAYSLRQAKDTNPALWSRVVDDIAAGLAA